MLSLFWMLNVKNPSVEQIIIRMIMEANNRLSFLVVELAIMVLTYLVYCLNRFSQKFFLTLVDLF